MPPQLYSGSVTNAATGRAEADAIVTASRNRKRGCGWLYGYEELACVRTDSSGRYQLTTTTGYAQRFHAQSADGRFFVWDYDVLPDDSVVDLLVKPGLSSVRSNAGRPSDWTTDRAKAIVVRLVEYIAAHPDAPLVSLTEYANRGVIRTSDVAFINTNQAHFELPSPTVTFVWGQSSFEFPGGSEPIRLR
jgi:hypothetical protein